MVVQLVLAYRASVEGTRSAGSASFLAMKALIILFAWWNTKASTEPMSQSTASSNSRTAGGTVRTEKLNTASPSSSAVLPTRIAPLASGSQANPSAAMPGRPLTCRSVIAAQPLPSVCIRQRMGGAESSRSSAVAEPASPNSGA